jgi:hypothetical protein
LRPFDDRRLRPLRLMALVSARISQRFPHSGKRSSHDSVPESRFFDRPASDLPRYYRTLKNFGHPDTMTEQLLMTGPATA